MAKVIVQTDDGREVWSMDEVESWHVAGRINGGGNAKAQALAAGIVRAVADAEKIQAGEDPRRPSEIAMQLADLARRGVLYKSRENGMEHVEFISRERRPDGMTVYREVFPTAGERTAMRSREFDETYEQVLAASAKAVV